MFLPHQISLFVENAIIKKNSLFKFSLQKGVKKRSFSLQKSVTKDNFWLQKGVKNAKYWLQKGVNMV